MSDAPRYETSDAPARPLLIAGVVLAVVLVLSLFVGDWLARRFLHDITSADQASPVQKLRREPLGPELDVVPGHDLVAHRAWEEEHLHGTAWVDPLNGVVRIPVERAQELCLAEGFPVRTGGGRSDAGVPAG